MARRTHRHHDYFSSSFDVSYWQAVLLVAAIVAIAAVAWVTS
jgi:hypothetical protein